MNAGRSQRRQEGYALRDLERSRYVRRPGIMVIIWRWRYELALVTVIAGLAIAIARFGAAIAVPALGVIAAVTITTAAAVARGAVETPRLRSRLTQLLWHIVTPHRVRTAFAQARIVNRAGRLPAVLRTRTVATGEEVLLWLPAGVTVDDLESERSLLAAASLAQTARVTRHSSHAHLVTLHILRPPQQTGESPHAIPRPGARDAMRGPNQTYPPPTPDFPASLNGERESRETRSRT